MYPSPPSARPISDNSTWDDRTVLRVCVDVSNGVTLDSACRSHGKPADVRRWRRRAEDGDDPFYVWMVACLDIAESKFLARVESTAGEVALDPGSKHYAKMAGLILSKRSKEFKKDGEEEKRPAGVQQMNVENLYLLIQGDKNGQGGMPAILQRAYKQPEIADKQEEHAPKERGPFGMKRREIIIEGE